MWRLRRRPVAAVPDSVASAFRTQEQSPQHPVLGGSCRVPSLLCGRGVAACCCALNLRRFFGAEGVADELPRERFHRVLYLLHPLRLGQRYHANVARRQCVPELSHLFGLDSCVPELAPSTADDPAGERRDNQAGRVDEAEDAGDDRATPGALAGGDFAGLLDVKLALSMEL